MFREMESKGLMTRFGETSEEGGKNGYQGPSLADWVDSSDSLLEREYRKRNRFEEEDNICLLSGTCERSCLVESWIFTSFD